MSNHTRRLISTLCSICFLFFSACSRSEDTPRLAEALPDHQCQYETTGTSEPATSGTPVVINETTGTVISANFFDSGAIDPPFFDGLESVSICVRPPDENGIITARISTDVGLDNDTRIKGYPQFVIGTKFGNQYETSFRYYSNSNLATSNQWPVVSDRMSINGTPYSFANLEYVSKIKGIELPAYTNSLPSIAIKLDLDEINVVGAERDIMLESWFYDTSANAQLIGNNVATGEPIGNTLNNIVGIGHKHYSELDNTLLEMMVHIGPLSPNDVSKATRNPGQHQLTETYSGKDHDGDGIDDHFDVDSHINVGTTQNPQPGKYSSGIDNNGDGIDDADVLPVTIGEHQYSIWYGESYLAPITIFSRESSVVRGVDFDPGTPDTDLSNEGEITLRWNEFIDYLRLELEEQLVALNVPWVLGGDNPFPKMFSDAGAIGGLELGVEPQINNPDDLPYTLEIKKFDVVVNNFSLGLTDRVNPRGQIVSPADNESLAPGIKNVTIKTTDDASGVAMVLVRLERIDTSPTTYWDSEQWSENPVWLRATTADQLNWSIENVDYNLAGEYRGRLRVIDNASNHSPSGSNPVNTFTIASGDTTAPTGLVTFPATSAELTSGVITVSGTSSDESGSIARVLARIERRDTKPVQYWNGDTWQLSSTWLDTDLSSTGDWSVTGVNVENPGTYAARIRVFDNAGNQATSQYNPVSYFSVRAMDTVPPTGLVAFPLHNTLISPGIYSVSGTASDENSGVSRVLVRIEKRHTRPIEYWDGQSWVTSSTWLPADLDERSSWSLGGIDMRESGSYRSRLRIYDGAGNQSRSSNNPVTDFQVQSQ